MSGGLLKYSGLVTKTKAMHGRLLEREELLGLSESESVEDLISFLKESDAYAPVYESHEEIHHRAQVEAVLHDSLYADYVRLYQFADREQRKCLEIIFLRYEINLLKSCLEAAVKGTGVSNKGYLELFFNRHASFDTGAVTQAKSVAELIGALAGTPYEKLFERMAADPTMQYGDWAFQLDLYYYRVAWRQKDKITDARQRQILAKILGTEIDWLNIMWIYRGRQFYRMNVADLAANMIPIRYRLRKEELQSMIEAESLEAFLQILSKTVYVTERDPVVRMDDEITFRKVTDRTYEGLCRKYPQSIAPVLKYLYDKEEEIDLLTTVLEGVRYQIPAREIREMILPGYGSNG